MPGPSPLTSLEHNFLSYSWNHIRNSGFRIDYLIPLSIFPFSISFMAIFPKDSVSRIPITGTAITFSGHKPSVLIGRNAPKSSKFGDIIETSMIVTVNLLGNRPLIFNSSYRLSARFSLSKLLLYVLITFQLVFPNMISHVSTNKNVTIMFFY